MLNDDSFQLSKDSSQLNVLIQCQDKAITTEELISAVGRSPFKDLKLKDQGLLDAVARINDVTLAGGGNSANELITIGERHDAHIEIDIAKDGMSAEATVTAPFGGKPLSLFDLVTKFREADIHKGFIKNNLDILVAKCAKIAPGAKVRILVARGKEPVHGKNSRFEALVPTAKDRIFRPQEVEGGKVDMRNLGEIFTADKNMPLMRRHPHEEGTEGYKVTGEVLAPKEGKELPFTPGPGTEVSPNNPDLLLSTMAGLPRVSDNGMTVDQVYQVKDVDVASGNVVFEGSVVITGNVGEGMKVTAKGDITVAGLVESAELVAGGDIAIAKGVIGRKTKGDGGALSCSLQAKGSITTKFVQYARLEAGKDLTVTSQMLHSQADVGGNVLVSNDPGTRGTLLGGQVTAGLCIQAVSVGAKVVNRTQLQIVGELPVLRLQKKKCNEKNQEQLSMLAQTLEAQAKIGKLPDSEKKQQLQVRLEESIDRLNQSIVELQQHLLDIDDLIETFYQQAQVVCLKELMPGVEISIADKPITTNKAYGRCAARLQEGRMAVCAIK